MTLLAKLWSAATTPLASEPTPDAAFDRPLALAERSHRATERQCTASLVFRSRSAADAVEVVAAQTAARAAVSGRRDAARQEASALPALLTHRAEADRLAAAETEAGAAAADELRSALADAIRSGAGPADVERMEGAQRDAAMRADRLAARLPVLREAVGVARGRAKDAAAELAAARQKAAVAATKQALNDAERALEAAAVPAVVAWLQSCAAAEEAAKYHKGWNFAADII